MLKTEDKRGRDASVVRKTELIISHVLRAGVLLSAAVVLTGVLDFYFTYSSKAKPVAEVTSLGAIWSGLGHAEPSSIVAVGLVLLLGTPVVRVAVSIIAFAVEHDIIYVGITALVLAILLFSFFSGLGGS